MYVEKVGHHCAVCSCTVEVKVRALFCCARKTVRKSAVLALYATRNKELLSRTSCNPGGSLLRLMVTSGKENESKMATAFASRGPGTEFSLRSDLISSLEKLLEFRIF